MTALVASDIDGTLTGDQGALDRLRTRLDRKRAAGELYLVMSTGRRLDQVLDGIATEGLPEPDAVICQVGTEIYLPPLQEQTAPMAAWRERLLADYSREQALAFLEDIEGLVMQPAMFNTELKTSCYLDKCPDPEQAAAEVRRRVEPYAGRYQVVWSSGRDLDILPAASGKGRAIRFLAGQIGLDPSQVVVAGDTGNDASMFCEFDHGIVVANAQPELIAKCRSLSNGRVYFARQPFAAGVEEGLLHFAVLDHRA